MNCGEASQLVEWINIQGPVGMSQLLAMYDLGTSCSVIDIDLAQKYMLERSKAQFMVSTVTGRQRGSHMYTFYLINKENIRVRVQALGVKMRQEYPMIKVKVREQWRGYFKGQSFQRASGGYLGLLLGSDQSGIHPRQVSFSESEVLWKSWISGHYLISGGRNSSSQPTVNKISVQVKREPAKKVNLAAKIVETKIPAQIL